MSVVSAEDARSRAHHPCGRKERKLIRKRFQGSFFPALLGSILAIEFLRGMVANGYECIFFVVSTLGKLSNTSAAVARRRRDEPCRQNEILDRRIRSPRAREAAANNIAVAAVAAVAVERGVVVPAPAPRRPRRRERPRRRRRRQRG